jgi:spore maturation protein CgeB
MSERLLLIGASGGTHVGESFKRAAESLSIGVEMLDVNQAAQGSRWMRALYWRLLDRRAPRMAGFQRQIVAAATAQRPHWVLVTGAGPVTAQTLKQLRALGAVCLNYSTDDPWNPVHRSRWQLAALKQYDHVCTPRTSNIEDFKRLGLKVHFVPFGFDHQHVRVDQQLLGAAASHEVLFVGGADAHRVEFMRAFIAHGGTPSLIGGYWNRWADMLPFAKGSAAPDLLAAITAKAGVVLGLVRRANRDGHVMRSFEAAATGACMVLEDTEEHRRLFGEDGQCVRYFNSPEQAAELCKELLRDPARREQLKQNARTLILTGNHTYLDRLQAMRALVESKEATS